MSLLRVRHDRDGWRRSRSTTRCILRRPLKKFRPDIPKWMARPMMQTGRLVRYSGCLAAALGLVGRATLAGGGATGATCALRNRLLCLGFTRRLSFLLCNFSHVVSLSLSITLFSV
jgi:hypothetical protein